ncbi:MAG: hypothetical protein U0L37_01785 [Bacteroidales bacterium]|nr:hypothetical protein [Bacteroidales bacterium]
MEELKEEFDKLNADLASPNCLNRKEKLDRMREILKEICEIQNFTIDDIIDSMDLEKLRELDGTLNRIQVQKKSDETNDEARATQIGMSEYSPGNPYPNNKKDKH